MRSWSILLLASLAILSAACGGGDFGGKGGWGKGGDEEKRDPLVEVVPAWRGSIPTLERSTGRVEAHNLADVYAQVSEVAIEVHHEVGDYVEQGTLLARLKSDELLLGLRASEIALQEAELVHNKNQLDLTKRKSELERIEKYFDPENPEASKLFSKEAYEAAKLEYDKARNALESSNLSLTKSRGEVAAAAMRLSHTSILAPISGVITERNLRANELVSGNALVFRIADFSVLEVKLDVAEARLSALREPTRTPGISVLALDDKVRIESAQAALLSITAFPQGRFLGYVDRISPTVDQARGMVVVTVRVIQPGSVDEKLHAPLLNQLDRDSRKAVLTTVQGSGSLSLRPGMWVDARIATEHIENALLIPGAAVVGDTEMIWVVTPDKDAPETGVARAMDISNRRGISSEGAIELKGPARKPKPDGGAEKGAGKGRPPAPEVKEGDLIVVRGQTLLREGQKVRIRDLSK
ncbi:MAG: efflux RND transporter periplasmic adaptor subunit [Planctomycetes bacterium]|nr:efflux RND transporter periplasmic adaptor subunit [Planctomycetota bacterium]